MADIDRSMLVGKWVHSHEEDAGDERVFRPAGYRLPPSRGRRSLELLGDGHAVDGRIGPDDRTAHVQSRWELKPGGAVDLTSPGGGTEKLQIVHLSPDKLVLKDAR